MRRLIFLVLFLVSEIMANEKIAMNSCCFCIYDDDKLLQDKCDFWLKENKKACDAQFSFHMDSLPYLASSNLSCNKSRIQGSFHAYNEIEYTKIPFKISKKVAETFASKEVCYDGASCLIFDNVEQVKLCAMELAANNKDCHFQISSNQNLGVNNRMGLKSCPLYVNEIAESASRLSVIIKDAMAWISYAPCSNPGEKCSVVSLDQQEAYQQSNNGPNLKFCQFRGQITTQTCCLKKKNKKTLNGIWSEIGRSCSEN